MSRWTSTSLRKESPTDYFFQSVGEELRFSWQVHTACDIIISVKTRIDIRIDKDLKDFLERYAKENHTTITQILIRYIVGLNKRYGHDLSVPNLSDSETREYIWM
jgi:uncharacterized protein (DUF1778 family)